MLALQVIQDFNSDINDTLTRINRKVSIWMISMSKKSGNMMPKLADITSMKYTNGRFGMKFRQILLSICNQATEGFPFCRSNFDLLSLSISRALALSRSHCLYTWGSSSTYDHRHIVSAEITSYSLPTLLLPTQTRFKPRGRGGEVYKITTRCIDQSTKRPNYW